MPASIVNERPVEFETVSKVRTCWESLVVNQGHSAIVVLHASEGFDD